MKLRRNEPFGPGSSTRSDCNRGGGRCPPYSWFIEKRLVDVTPHWRAPKLTIHLATLPGRYRPRRLQVFLDCLRAEMAKIPGIEPP
jgi:DNA-binding transcriptional LysR family regulator